jgi:hypothetical protein
MLVCVRIEMPSAGAAIGLARAGRSLSGALAARITGPIDEDRLRDALAGLAERHPLAATRVAVGEGDRPCFTTEGVGPISLHVIGRTSDEQWLSELRREIQNPADYLAGPLLRCLWLRSSDASDLILIGEHLTAYGRYVVKALRDLLTLLADPSITLPPVMPRRLADLVPADVVERLRGMAAERSAEQPSGVADFPVHSPPNGGRGTENGHSAEHSAQPDATSRPPLDISVHLLSWEQTTALADRCRQEGVTVQVALCAAFLMPFAEQNPDMPVRRAEVPVDLRPYLSAGVDVYGNLISLALVDVDCRPGRGFWELARHAATALAAATREDRLFATPFIAMQLFEQPRNPRPGPWRTEYDVSISNLGRIGIPARYGSFTIESISPPIFPATGPNHRIVGVSTFAGQMRYSFSCRSAQARVLLERGRELLLEMVG